MILFHTSYFFSNPFKFEFRELSIVIGSYDPTIYSYRSIGKHSEPYSSTGRMIIDIKKEFQHLKSQSISDHRKTKGLLKTLHCHHKQAKAAVIQFAVSHDETAYCDAVRLEKTLEWIIEDIMGFGLKAVG